VQTSYINLFIKLGARFISVVNWTAHVYNIPQRTLMNVLRFFQ